MKMKANVTPGRRHLFMFIRLTKYNYVKKNIPHPPEFP